MRILLCFLVAFIAFNKLYNQKKVVAFPVNAIEQTFPVTLYDGANFSGTSKNLGVGQFKLDDFNNLTSSIKVQQGYCAIIYDNADDGGGYGVYIDFLEDCPDLSALNFDNKASYINIFKSEQASGLIWVRNNMVKGTFVSGHWERKKANGPPQNNSIAVAGPPLPPHGNANVTVMNTSGPVTTIQTLGTISNAAVSLWNTAVQDQQGIIGNDYRGVEEIGSACFERASNNPIIPDNLNFWYPQRQKNDHRSVVFFKRTLAGRVREAHQSEISGTYQDYDVNIDITPFAKYNYLLTDAHPSEYTDIMSAQYHGTRVLPYLQDEGQKDCNDPASKAEFTYLEAEIAPEYWPQGNHVYGRSGLTDMCLARVGDTMCVYGVWLYDRGHCCHPEIHPAEELWWSRYSPSNKGRIYNCNVICDASKRFLWRKQMDDGVKLKPWGEPPIKGLFAIAFEVQLGSSGPAAGQIAKQYEVGNVDFPNVNYNINAIPNAEQVYKLTYQNKTLVSFIPHNNAFKVSFENVGLMPGTNTVRGFLVIETSVGLTKQIATSIKVLNGNIVETINLAQGSTPAQADQRYEDKFFQKQDGRYMFKISETNVQDIPVNQ